LMSQKISVLAFGAHPDDVEMGCGGTVLKLIQSGRSVGIIDLTIGEMGTRGSSEIRTMEAENAGKKLGISIREYLGLKDGMIGDSPQEISAVIRVLRKYQPDIVLASAMEDRHPDHGHAATLIEQACFFSGLKNYPIFEDKGHEPWRPRIIYHYIQDRYLEPDFIVDISSQYDKRKEAIDCYKSQFYKPGSKEDETYISSKIFQSYLEARAISMGHRIGVAYGEGFTGKRKIGVDDLGSLI
jgi:N-acetylglucosamine malate deacetylase 1